MQFEEISLSAATGWTLAHSIEVNGTRIPKNSLISADITDQLLTAGISTVLAYKLDANDLGENNAAQAVAAHISGPGVEMGQATRGRCNVYAAANGIFRADPAIDALNSIGQSIGVATLPDYAPVSVGKLVATVKIIPYGVAKMQIETITAAPIVLSIAPYRPFKAAILASGTAMSAKAVSVTQIRAESVGGAISTVETCPHTVSSVAAKLEELAHQDNDLLLLSGISAISDRRDILPSALVEAGGMIVHLGMPVDPGNLLMLGELKGKTVIGIPGCAKSPSLNGFDWALERFAAGLPLDGATIQMMGIGGLLKEPVDRPEPRAPGKAHTTADTAAILLAAGKSTRSGHTHKLLANLDDKPVIEQSVIALKEAGFQNIIVVTGAREVEIKAALAAQTVQFAHNSDYESGMATSIKVGVEALAETVVQCVICLGDMPFVRKETYRGLVSAANRISDADIFAPTFRGKRGNPVLWRQGQFEKLRRLSGDKGGRAIMREHETLVCDVAVEDPGILIDLDTPEALKQFGIKVTG